MFINQAALTDINGAADFAYETVTTEWRLPADREVHRLKACHRLSVLMVEELNDRGYDAAVETRLRQGTADEHSYPLIQIPRIEEDVVGDPAWQQFVPRNMIGRRSPKVLIGTRSHVIGTLRAHGVYDETILGLWS